MSAAALSHPAPASPPPAARDPSIDTIDLFRLLAAECERLGSQAAFARRVGCSRSHVGLVLNGMRAPNSAMLHAIGYRAVIRYVPLRAGAAP